MLTFPDNIKKLKRKRNAMVIVTAAAYLAGIIVLIPAALNKSTEMFIAFAFCFLAGMLLFTPLAKSVVKVRTATAQWLEGQVIQKHIDIKDICLEENVINMLERNTLLVPGYKQLVEAYSYHGEYRGHEIEISNWQVRENVRGGFLWLQEHEFIYYNRRLWHCPNLLDFKGNIQIYSKTEDTEQLAEILTVFDDDVYLEPVEVSYLDFDEKAAVLCDDPGDALKVISKELIEALSDLCSQKEIILNIAHNDVFILCDQQVLDKRHDIKTEEDAQKLMAGYEDDITSVLPVINALIEKKETA